ncbi:MAG: SDR family NAD(P)-dependent oxidoreductase, partial [Myxococcota bacterium]|nr:SDR family NAD(P)-dependent oxidoreductase [Myxococcota bacterium]
MTALILGSTSKIALEIAHRYAELGHTIVLAARNLEDAERSAADIRIRHDVPCHAIQFDALDIDSHPKLIADVEKRAGPIEIGLLAFGDMGTESPPFDDFEMGRRVIGINYTGAASLGELMATRMAQRQRGLIIGLSSVAGDRGRQSNYLYGSAKGAFTLFLQG